MPNGGATISVGDELTTALLVEATGGDARDVTSAILRVHSNPAVTNANPSFNLFETTVGAAAQTVSIIISDLFFCKINSQTEKIQEEKSNKHVKLLFLTHFLILSHYFTK